MATAANALRQLAALGGTSAFLPSNPVPLISPKGFYPRGDWSTVDAILANGASDHSNAHPIGLAGSGYRLLLGTNALRALLKAVRASNAAGDLRNEVIVPALTVKATVEAVIDEGFTPVFVDVNEDSWMISPEATARDISNKTAAIITVDWLGSQCNLLPFRKLADKHGVKLISDSAQSFGASPGKPPSVDLAHATIYSLGYPKVFTGAGSGGVVVCPKPLADRLEKHPTDILRHETMAEINAFMCLRALESPVC
ncbi:pyridoxal phosphate-dependent transferase [Chaetomidium leptoderma]|uniref:Pyridoxal phosphate-dependent transferase n=1 Tax=Chaetomidium leptoderma TaxID=669021 RepID=A0AAN6VC03_9PEZI|nr:pyridoxal phosphate-dependent transferase [Chaetomidium leptoderma]